MGDIEYQRPTKLIMLLTEDHDRHEWNVIVSASDLSYSPHMAVVQQNMSLLALLSSRNYPLDYNNVVPCFSGQRGTAIDLGIDEVEDWQ